MELAIDVVFLLIIWAALIFGSEFFNRNVK